MMSGPRTVVSVEAYVTLRQERSETTGLYIIKLAFERNGPFN